jgi:restriction system protein
MLPVLKAASHGDIRVADAASLIATELKLTSAQTEELLPSGRQRLLNNRIHWAKFYMSKAGLLESPARGRFIASNRGLALLATKPDAISVETLKSYPEFVAFYSGGGRGPAIAQPSSSDSASAAALTTTPEEQIDAAHAVLHRALKVDLLERILAQSPAFFERVIVELLVSMGYGGSHANATAHLGKSGDGGVDGMIAEDRLGLDRVYVQAKRYAGHIGVGRPEIQGFVGSLVGLGASKGVFVTTSSFSSHALDYVRHLPQRVVLIDGEALTELMVEHGVGVRVSRNLALKRLDEDFFNDE